MSKKPIQKQAAVLVSILLLLTPIVIAEQFSYDANGNLISDGSFHYVYNEANQLSKVCQDEACTSVIAQYWYDYTGQRVKKVENGKTTYYIGEHYEETDGQPTSYYFINGERVAKKNDTGIYYYLKDHLGSTNVIVDSNGNEVDSARYMPFGESIGDTINKYLFTDQEFDLETGLYYYGARYYNPAIKRFIQPDPVIQDPYDPQMLNRYSYVRNNPLKYVDPTGNYYMLLYYLAGAVTALTEYSVAITTSPDFSVDYPSFQASLDACRADGCSRGEAVDLAVDTASLLLPIVSLGAMKKISNAGDAARAGRIVRHMDSKTIRYTQDSANYFFKNMETGEYYFRYSETGEVIHNVDELAEGLKSGRFNPSAPEFKIRVVEKNGKLYTLDNRRLYAFQEAGMDIPVEKVSLSDLDIAKDFERKFKPIKDGAEIIIRNRPN